VDFFQYRSGVLCAESVPVADIAACYGTPCYVYSRATITRHWRAFDDALQGFDHLVCYAVKASSNLAILNLLARLGSGFDIVSGGELARVLAAGGDSSKVVFSGVGKSEAEIRTALSAGIGCFNVESEGELKRITAVARDLDKTARVALRVNPDVDAGTHPYIATGLKESKFGIEVSRARELYEQIAACPQLEGVGIDCHIGSQLTDIGPFVDAIGRVLEVVDDLARRGITLTHLNIGGGLGIRYQEETPPEPAQYIAALSEVLESRPLKILVEPGRAIMGNAGILVTRVEYLKSNGEHHFAIVDAAMNDLLRPALYNAWQEIVPVHQHPERPARVYDVVGPVCETGDFLGKGRSLQIEPGDLLAVRSAGAYGFSMSSNYNSRPRAAEVMVDGDQAYLIREREQPAQLYAGEHLLPRE